MKLGAGLKKKAVQEPGPVPLTVRTQDKRQTVPHDDCVANSWNMNSLEPATFRKLKAWIERSYRESGRLALPIVIRTHPTLPGKWEIIDGYHRWKACGELKRKDVDCWIYECDDKAARLLTDALNYLRGTPNAEKYADYLQSLTDVGVGRDEIAQFTHMTGEELDEFSSTYDIKLEDIPSSTATASDADQDEAPKDPDEWIEMKFVVPRSAAEVIEAELARIGDTLTGKNVRGRALEFAMVNSALTPLPDGQEPEARAAATKTKLGMLAGKRRRDGRERTDS